MSAEVIAEATYLLHTLILEKLEKRPSQYSSLQDVRSTKVALPTRIVVVAVNHEAGIQRNQRKTWNAKIEVVLKSARRTRGTRCSSWGPAIVAMSCGCTPMVVQAQPMPCS